MTLTIPTIRNTYSLNVPAHRFQQGGRDAYYFALDFDRLDSLLPQRVDDNIVRESNRRLTPSHAQAIQRYLEEKDDWLLGALLLGIAPDAIEFAPYSNEGGEPESPNFGELRILANRVNTMRIFDGQHRRRAIQEVLAELSGTGDNRDATKLASLRRASMTIVLYAEDDTKKLRQMFVDASRTKRIEGHTVTRFDRRDAFNLTAVRLSEDSRLFKERVEMERPSVTASSQNLLAVNQLAAILKNLAVAYGGRVSRDLNDTFMQDLDGLYKRCLEWSDDFMPAAREEYNYLISGEIDNSEIPRLRLSTFAYNAFFIRVLAICYYEWLKEHKSWTPLADFIHKSSVTRPATYGLLVDAGLVNPDGTALFTRRQEVARAVNYIIRAASQ